MKRLEEKKDTLGYTAITDEDKKNLKHFILLVKRSIMQLDALYKKEIIKKKPDEYPPGLINIDNIVINHGTYAGIVTLFPLFCAILQENGTILRVNFGKT